MADCERSARIRELVDQAPPLTPDQRARLSTLLAPAAKPRKAA